MQRVVAKHIGFHGLKGELKLYPLVEDIEVFNSFSELFISGEKFEIESCRFHKKFALVKLKDFDDLTAVETKFPEKNTLVEADLVDDLDEGEYYLEDLKGLKVERAGQIIGTVYQVTDSAQTLLYIRLKEDGKTLLLPFVDEYIETVDQAASIIKVEFDDSFLELAQ